MIAYEMIETVRNQPTTFQFNLRKNTLPGPPAADRPDAARAVENTPLR
jgi:hypothetical protein